MLSDNSKQEIKNAAHELAFISAQVAEVERVIADLDERDFLGLAAFNYRRRKLEDRRRAIHSQIKSASIQPSDESANSGETLGSGTVREQG